MKSKIARRIMLAVGIAVSVVCIILLGRHIDFSKSMDVIRGVHPLMFVAVMAIYLLTFPLRSLRWKLMMESFGVHQKGIFIQSLFIGFAGNNVLPARGGELLRMQTFSRRTGIGHGTSLTSILLEKVFDVFILMLFLVAAFMGMRKNIPLLRNTVYFIVPATFVVVGAIAILSKYGQEIIQWFQARNDRFSVFTARLLKSVYGALHFVRSGAGMLKILLLSLLIWSMEVGVYAVGLRAIGIEHALLLVSMTGLVMVNFSILIPSSPGYIGVYQAAFVLALAMFNIPNADALAASILIHAGQFIPVSLLGLIFGARYMMGPQKE